MINKIKGKVLFLNSNCVYFSKGLTIYCIDKLTSQVSVFFRLPVFFFLRILSKFDLISRLLRLHVHHMLEDGFGGFYLLYHNKILRVDKNGNIVGAVCELVGKRPLCVLVHNGDLLYGEYTSNSSRNDVSIFSFNGTDFHSLFKVPNIRHIHGIFYDNYDDKFLITTGDFDSESGIWHVDFENDSLIPILNGSQQERAVQLLFTDNFIYYATDTPSEQNYIYRYNKRHKFRERLSKISSSVFFGVSLNNRFYFSTVAEPSLCNNHRQIFLLEVDNKSVKVVKSFKKDFFSMKYFQYGQLIFPNFSTDDSHASLWVYKHALIGSGYSERVF